MMLENIIPQNEETYRLVVRKSNKLINSRNSFTTIQNRILLLMLVSVKESAETGDFGWIEIPIQKVIDAKGLKAPKGAQYQQVKASAIEMSSSSLYIRQENGKWKTIPLIKADGDDASGTIRVKFVDDPDTHDVVHNIFLKGGSGYTSYLLDVGLSFKKKYTLRLYEKLKRASNQSQKRILTIELSIETLKFELYLEKKYPNSSDFKKWVIDPSVKEINKLSDLSVKCTPNKKRGATAYHFSIERKSGFDASEGETVIDVPFEEMSKPSPAPKAEKAETTGSALAELAKTYGQAYTEFCWHEVQKKANIQNPMAYLKKALQQDYFKEQYLARQQKQEQEQQADLLKSMKDMIEKSFQQHYNEQVAACLEKITAEEKQQYIGERTKSNNTMWRKYAREVESGNPSRLATINLATWYIDQHGTPELKQEMEIAHFAKAKFGVDWSKLVD